MSSGPAPGSGVQGTTAARKENGMSVPEKTVAEQDPQREDDQGTTAPREATDELGAVFTYRYRIESGQGHPDPSAR